MELKKKLLQGDASKRTSVKEKSNMLINSPEKERKDKVEQEYSLYSKKVSPRHSRSPNGSGSGAMFLKETTAGQLNDLGNSGNGSGNKNSQKRQGIGKSTIRQMAKNIGIGSSILSNVLSTVSGNNGVPITSSSLVLETKNNLSSSGNLRQMSNIGSKQHSNLMTSLGSSSTNRQDYGSSGLGSASKLLTRKYQAGNISSSQQNQGSNVNQNSSLGPLNNGGKRTDYSRRNN